MKKITILILMALTFTASGCRFGRGVKGNGNVVKDNRKVEEFSKIHVSGVFHLIAEVGDETSVVVSAEENLMKYIRTRVKGDMLIIDSKKNLNPRKPMKIYVTVPELFEVEASGATNADVSGINSSSFYVDVSGAATCELEGEVKKLSGDVSGAASLDARDLLCQSVKVDVSGAANAKVYSRGVIDADASGASSLVYYGNPEEIRTDVSGAASIRRK